MRKILIVFIIGLIAASGLFAADKITGKVVSVADGDTVTVFVGKEQFKIRLAEIDCAEKKQAFGKRAKKFTSDIIYGKTVTVYYTGKDRYGRYIGEIITDHNINVNIALIEAGLAWHYKQYSKSKELADAENKARSLKKGLWADKNPIPPWEWRRKK